MIPVSNLSYLGQTNLQLEWVSTTSLKVLAGVCKDDTNTFDMTLPSDTTIDCTINGANGLDTGSLANNTWYRVYVISQKTGFSSVKTLVSTSATPVMPSGYDLKRRIGWARTDGSAHFKAFYTFGSGNVRLYQWLTAQIVLSGGTATAFASVDIDAGVPPVDKTPVVFRAEITPNAPANAITISNSSLSVASATLSGVVAAVKQVAELSSICSIVTSKANIEYKVSSASDSGDLYVHQFVDYI